MRGFSSSFPRGGAGFGLLVLRLAVALQLLLESGRIGAPPWGQMALVAGAALALVLVLVLVLALGALTPAAGALSAAFQALCLAHAGWADAAPPLIAIMTAITLVLIGPGAYSVDARLFGRRRLVLPASSTDGDGDRF